MTKEGKIILFFTLLVFAGIGALIALSESGTTGPADPAVLVRDDSRMTGTKGAKVTLVEFGDYQCPSCAAAHPIVERILEDYKSNPNFNFVYRHFPLPQHQYAKLAGQAAEAAGMQGKYWEMHARLYENQNTWALAGNPQTTFEGYAQIIGLDVNKFKTDMKSDAASDAVNDGRYDGNAVGVSSTPTFFINNEIAVGVPNYDGLKSKIDTLLSQ